LPGAARSNAPRRARHVDHRRPFLPVVRRVRKRRARLPRGADGGPVALAQPLHKVEHALHVRHARCRPPPCSRSCSCSLQGSGGHRAVAGSRRCYLPGGKTKQREHGACVQTQTKSNRPPRSVVGPPLVGRCNGKLNGSAESTMFGWQKVAELTMTKPVCARAAKKEKTKRETRKRNQREKPGTR